MINVTKTYLPPFERYVALIKRAYDAGWITNNGQLVQELEARLKEFLNVENLYFCNNGTITLQIALKALNITGDVITTPFSYVATTNAILWENCHPVFVDIDQETLCIDANLIEKSITSRTTAILATHVYGIPCQVEAIEVLAAKYNLKVIYDAAHAFGAKYNGRSLLSYGDVSSCSFHATKLFHTVEGGCLVTSDKELGKKIYYFRQFGHEYEHYESVGINAKNSEVHAAMGLAVLPDVSLIIEKRRILTEQYNRNFKLKDVKPVRYESETYEPNYAYYPVIFKSEEIVLKVISALEKEEIKPRRYFYPSLNKLPYISAQASCPVSESIAARVLCLPLFYELQEKEVDRISQIIIQNL